MAMDNFSIAPMPSLTERVEYLLYYIRKNNIVVSHDINRTEEIAIQVAENTPVYSLAGYEFGQIRSVEINNFITALQK